MYARSSSPTMKREEPPCGRVTSNLLPSPSQVGHSIQTTRSISWRPGLWILPSPRQRGQSSYSTWLPVLNGTKWSRSSSCRRARSFGSGTGNGLGEEEPVVDRRLERGAGPPAVRLDLAEGALRGAVDRDARL